MDDIAISHLDHQGSALVLVLASSLWQVLAMDLLQKYLSMYAGCYSKVSLAGDIKTEISSYLAHLLHLSLWLTFHFSVTTFHASGS